MIEKIPLSGYTVFEDSHYYCNSISQKKFWIGNSSRAGNWSGTLANALLYYDSEFQNLIDQALSID
jgi:hypothetical protein